MASGQPSSHVVISQPRPGLRVIDDNPEDGVFFLGAGGWNPAGGVHAGSNSTNGGPAASVVETRGPSVAQPKSNAWGSGKPSWSKVAAQNAPPQLNTVAAVADGASSPVTDTKSSQPLCSFFMSGSCRNGDRCKFRHAKAEPWAIEFFEQEIQLLRNADKMISEKLAAEDLASKTSPAAAAGHDGGGGAKPAVADDDDAFAADSLRWQSAALALRNDMLEKAVTAGVCSSVEEAEVALQAAERVVSSDVECSICIEPVMSVPGRRFGLLSNCTHPFCLDCIRQWRARIDLPKETVRSCPICRQVSYYVISSDRYIADSARKAVLSQQYHSAQRSIPCRHWNYGRGECPFGSSCFYAHLNPDLTPAISTGAHSFRMDSEGNVFGSKQYKLNEFL